MIPFKILTYEGFRTMAAWLLNLIKQLFQQEKDNFQQDIDAAKDDCLEQVERAQDTYKGARFLTQEEYDELVKQNQVQEETIYFIEEQ